MSEQTQRRSLDDRLAAGEIKQVTYQRCGGCKQRLGALTGNYDVHAGHIVTVEIVTEYEIR